MDENSCEDETSKSVENVVDRQKPKEMDNSFQLEDMKLENKLEDGIKRTCQILDRCGSSYDASVSGTSTGFSSSVNEEKANAPEPVEDVKVLGQEEENMRELNPSETKEEEDENVSENTSENENQSQNQNPSENEEHPTLLPIEEEPRYSQPPPIVEQLTMRKTSIGPPPSYSFVMKQKKRLKLPSVDPVITNRPPPPAYGGPRGLFTTPEENRLDRMCNLPSFREPVWRSHSQPAFCTRCGVLVLTTTHSHDSVATHVAALTLCLFGCWPCCLLPYCMSVCKNTYHHCPLCQSFLGLYSPW